MTFRLYSNELQDGAKMPERQVFNGMGYHGDNLSPHLAWDGVPEGTKSFVISVYDPDAPTGSGKGGLPAGAIQTRTDFGSAGYGGAAPPQGESHRYHFTVHALDVASIEVDEGSSGALVGFNVHFHSLGSATLTVKYS